jgi:thiol-disulfide isomerase/thioredoxin
MQIDRTVSTWFALGLLTLSFAPAVASAEDGWLHEFDEASAAAKQQGKELLIDFSGTDWCVPCKQLWNDVLSQPEFIALASRDFVLLDIDLLVRGEMPEGRKERYEALEKRYGIQAHPTVVLATAEGLPYATTGMLDSVNDPRGYWRFLSVLHERGAKLRAALDPNNRQDTAGARANTIVATLAELRPDFVVHFYGDTIELLRKLTPSDETGYLAFIDLHAALFKLEHKLHELFLASLTQWENDGEKAPLTRTASEFSPADVDAIIATFHPRGGGREALVVRFSKSTRANGRRR